MDWEDDMGWQIDSFSEMYGIKDYLLQPLIANLDAGQALSEEDMVHLYNCMDMYVQITIVTGKQISY